MENDFVNEEIRKFIKSKNRFIVEIIDLKKGIYVYTKENKDDKWTGPPLYINKKTKEYKFLFPADIINDHKELGDYNTSRLLDKK